MIKFSICINKNIKKNYSKILNKFNLYIIQKDLCKEQIITVISTVKKILKI
jgi:hypothetical protein